MNDKVLDFLNKYHMASCEIDVKESLKRFEKEIERGLSGSGPISEYSIPMIATYLNPNINPSLGSKVIVIDAGGTNLRVGLASFNGAWQLSDVKEYKMPGIEREYSNDEFFDYIAKRAIP